MVFDSHYDEFRGAITYVRLMNGTVDKGQKITVPPGGNDARGARTGPVRPATQAVRQAVGRAGRLPDLRHQVARPRAHRRYRQHARRVRPSRCQATRNPSGWCSAGCTRRTARISSSFATRSTSWRSTTRASSSSRKRATRSGFGFRCGFLGLLHMEIVQQRLEQEADIDLVQTAPNVTYEIDLENGRDDRDPHAARMPDDGRDRRDPPADRPRQLRAADRVHRPGDEALHRSPRRFTCGPNTSRRPGRCWSTTWPWPT